MLETKCEESSNTTRETWCELAMVEIGEVYKEKSSGPRTEPWGNSATKISQSNTHITGTGDRSEYIVESD